MLPAVRLATAAGGQVWRLGARRAFSGTTSLLAKKYTSSHEWVEVEGNIATIGITKFAADALGDVVYVELPEQDVELKQKEAMGAVESVKSASDIYAPVTGRVIETNSALEETPKTINDSSETDGWIVKLELSEPEQVDSLMSKEEYDAMEK